MYNLILSATLVVAFFMCVSAYCLGLRHGKQLSNGKVPEVKLNPVKTVTEALKEVKQAKIQDKLNEELTDIMGVTKESMLESIKRG